MDAARKAKEVVDVALHRKQITYSERPNHAARSAHARGDKEFRTYDTSYIRPKQSKAPIVIAVIILVLAAIAIIFAIQSCVAPKVELLPESEEAVITVEPGETAYAIGDTLSDNHLVASADSFVNRVIELDAATSLIPGTYVFTGGTSLDDIISILQVGPSATGDTLVISEGLTRETTAAAVESATNGRITADEFLNATDNASLWAADYPFLETAGDNSLEGFLFPKTYDVTVADDVNAIVRMMLDQFGIETADLDWSYPESQGLDLYETVILASIVEKEAHSDASMVASVFYNRLDSTPAYLNSDATTAYEVGHDPSAEEVHANTPYSTYTNTGLPPTPICSPGLVSLEAVCSPDDTDYFYFYYMEGDDGEGKNYFSVDYEDHQALIDSSR